MNDFNDNGYILIKNYFTDDEANNIVRWANELENWNEEAYKWMIFFEKHKILKNLENFGQFRKFQMKIT